MQCSDDPKAALNEGRNVYTVMIDLSKASDSIGHFFLLKNLEDLDIQEAVRT